MNRGESSGMEEIFRHSRHPFRVQTHDPEDPTQQASFCMSSAHCTGTTAGAAINNPELKLRFVNVSINVSAKKFVLSKPSY